MPRVILAPIFAVWFGLGMLSKIALGVTLVFFVVFFNVYQGVREVSPVVLASSRMLGATKKQLLRTVYLPSATSWVFSSLHIAVGMAFVGAVIGEYMGSEAGVGYLILQAEGRSEEHTSELQSLMRISYAVFCLKKKTNMSKTTTSRAPDNTMNIQKYKTRTTKQ